MATGLPQRPHPASASAPSAGPATRPVVAPYDTVTVPLRYGLEALDILRLRRACGSVLQAAGGTAIAFLVPPGTSARWHLPGSACTPGAPVLPPADPGWVIAPVGRAAEPRPTDPWVLRAALCEAACTLAAGGLGPF